MTQYGCSLDHARTLTGELRLAEFYEKVSPVDTALAATWVADTLLGELNYRDMSIVTVNPNQFITLLTLLRDRAITDKSGVEVLRNLLDQLKDSGCCESPEECVKRLNLTKAEGEGLSGVIEEVIAEHPRAVADYAEGKKEAFNFLVGQVMRKTRGRVDPVELNRALSERLEGV